MRFKNLAPVIIALLLMASMVSGQEHTGPHPVPRATPSTGVDIDGDGFETIHFDTPSSHCHGCFVQGF